MPEARDGFDAALLMIDRNGVCLVAPVFDDPLP